MAVVKILLVEDESIEAMDIKRTLESFGYNVAYVASSGEEAVEKTLEIIPDLILMDIVLKGDSDGIEAVSKIKDLNIPVIYLTAHSEESTIERAKLTEPYGYIIKPYDRTELKYAIELAIYKNKMQKQLKDNEEKFLKAFNENLAAMAIADEKGKYVDVNKRFQKLTGFSKKELIGHTSSELNLTNPKIRESILNEAQKNPVFDKELEIQTKSGEKRIVLNRIKSFKQSGKIRFISFIEDITARKKAEENLIKDKDKLLDDSEEKYQRLFDTMVHGVVYYNENGKITSANPAAEKILGLSIKQMKGLTSTDPILKSIHEDGSDFPGDTHPAMVALKTGKKIKNIIMGVCVPKREKTRWIKINACPEFKENKNRPYQVYATFEDVTNEKRAEVEVQNEKDKLSALINSIPDEVWFADKEKKFTLANPSAQREFGLSSSEIDVEKMASNLEVYRSDGSVRPVDEAPTLRALKGEIVKNNEEIIRTPNKNELRYHQVSASPVKDTNNNIIGSVSVVRDITEHKKAEEALIVSEKRYRELFSSMIEMFHVIELIYDKNGNAVDYYFRNVNPAFCRFVGKTRDQLVDKRIKDIFGIVEDYWLEFYDRVAKTGKPDQFENYGAELDKYYDVHAWKVENNEIAIIFTDITERKQAEAELSSYREELENLVKARTAELEETHKALKESEENFRAIAENSIDSILIAVENGKHVYVNPKAAELTGYSKEELLNTHIEDIAHPDEIVNLKERYDLRMVGKHISSTYETRIVRKDNEIVPIEISAARTIWKDQPAVMVQVRDITTRKKIEEKLKLASLYNRSLIEASLDPLVTIGPDGKVTDVNKATETVTGYSRDEIIGSDFSDYFTEPEKAKKGYKMVFLEGFVKDYPLEIQHKDGLITPVLYNATVYKDESGEIVGMFAAARDMRKIKQAEDELRESERKYRNIFEESFDGLFITSPEGKILDMNKKGIEMFGYNTKEEILSLDLIRDVYADSNDRKKILAMVNEQGSAEYEVVVKKKNGDKMITHCSLTAVKDKGAITTYRGIIRDINESKKAENDIIRAKEEWENTFDAVPDLIAILDTNFRVVRANKAMADRLNVTPEETVGLTCYEVVHGLDVPPSYCPYRKLLEDGKEHTAEVHEDRIGGDFIVSVSPLHDKDGKLIGVVHVARDITQRKKTENEIKKSLDEKEVLLREIHHRVKNNLQIIASLLHLQEVSEDEKEIVDVLRESEGRVKSMAMVHEKLYQSPNLTDINFKQYIEKLIYDILYTYKIPTRTIKTNMIIEDINLNIDTAIPLGLIVNELVTNSVKHAFPQSEGTITIKLKPLHEQIELTIADNGIGLPKDFDLEKTETLGLKIVNSLVNQIDGKIKLDMTDGTEFKINFKELKYKERL